MKATFKGVVFEVESAEDFKLLVGCVDEAGEDKESDEFGKKIVEFMDEAASKEKRGPYKKTNANKQWTKEDDAFLKANLDKPRGKLAKELGRTRHAISVRMSLLRSGKVAIVGQKTKIDELNTTQARVLLLAGRGMLPKDIAKEVGASLQSVYNAMYFLRKEGHLTKHNKAESKKIVRVPFSNKELQFLKDNHDKLPYVTLAEQLNRPYSSIVSKLEELGFKKFPKKKEMEEKSRKEEPKVDVMIPSKVREAKKQAKKLAFDTLSRNPELQPLASDLVLACAKSKIPLKLSELVTVLSISEGEAKVLLVDIFNNQRKVFDVIGRKNGKIIWKGDELIFR